VESTSTLPRPLVRSLLANMFLCTFESNPYESLPWRSFALLLKDGDRCEMAKLRMFLNYFEQTREGVEGTLKITRRSIDFDQGVWCAAEMPLLPMQVVPPMKGALHGSLACTTDPSLLLSSLLSLSPVPPSYRPITQRLCGALEASRTRSTGISASMRTLLTCTSVEGSSVGATSRREPLSYPPAGSLSSLWCGGWDSLLL